MTTDEEKSKIKHVASQKKIRTDYKKKNKKLKKVVIPATIRSIGKKAFAGCKNLKKITVKTPYLTKKSVGAKAFKGIHAKAAIKVPKKKKKAYTSLFKAKGVGKKVKIK